MLATFKSSVSHMWLAASTFYQEELVFEQKKLFCIGSRVSYPSPL